MVVGQEYTDFDKGLEDGIEGEVFGFNLLTSELTTRHGSLGLPWFPAHDNTLVLPQNHYEMNSAGGTLRAFSSGKKLIRWPEDDTSRSRKVPRGVRWPDNHRNGRRAPQVRFREPVAPSLVTNPGLELAERSYRQCADMRGSPVDQRRLLIAWASTPVRVFGGAIIKGAKPACGNF